VTVPRKPVKPPPHDSRPRSGEGPLDATGGLVAPAAVRILDLEAPLPDVQLPVGRLGAPYESLLVVARLDGDPLGAATISVDPPGRVPCQRLEHGLRHQLEADGRAAFARRGLAFAPALPRAAVTGSRARARDTPARPCCVSVVVTTCCDPVTLERCLRSILGCDYDQFEVIVVENRPGSSATRRMVVERFADEPRVRYVEEPSQGLSRARNTGLNLAEGEVVAFTDDDVIVDSAWIRRCAEAFERADDVACVTGLILPLELETHSQLLLEQFATFGKGFRRRTYRLREARSADPLFPYTPGMIGSGANTVLRADVGRELGGFEASLGAGTPARGGEDLELYIRLLREGYAVAYEPGAIVWHEHPDGPARLRRQVYRYGVGLGAMLTQQLVVGPERSALLRAVPAGIRYARDPASRKNAAKTAGYPRRLDWLERVGMVIGPAAYLASALRAASRRRRHLRDGALERRAMASPAERALTASALVACLTAPPFVALGFPTALRFPAVLALLCTAPGTALLIALRERLDAALAVGASLAASAVLAQSMLSLGVWQPEALVYVLAVACLPPLLGRVAVPPVRPGLQRVRDALSGTPHFAAGHGTLLAVALVAWAASLAGADLGRIADLGLLNAMPPTYFLAFALLLIGFALAVTREELAPKLLGAYVVALILVLHGTTPLLYEEPRYAWTYAHLGVVDFIAETGAFDRQVDIYNNWPGLFATNALLSSASALSPASYAAWAQVFFNAANVVAVRFALRGVTDDERLLWTASWLFLLGNWLGQDYLAPQPFALALSLVVLGLCLRCAPSRCRLGRLWRALRGSLRAAVPRAAPVAVTRSPAPLSPRAAIAVGGICYLAVVISHQLSPIMLLASVAAVALFARRIPLWLLVAMAVVEAGWLLLASPFLSGRFELFNPDPGASRVPPGYSLGDGLPGLAVVTIAARAVVVVMVALAAIGLVRRLRAGHWDLAVLSLGLVPLLLLGVQSYGGEGRLRVYLFALPWLSFLAAAACLAPVSWRSRALRSSRLAAASVALGYCMLPAYFGLELVNRVTKDDVAASAWFEKNAPPGSLLVGATTNFPTRLSARYPRVYNREYTSSPILSDEEALRGRRLSSADLPQLERTLRGYGVPNVYLSLTVSQERFARLYGVFPAGSLPRLDRALRGSPSFRLVYRHGRSSVFSYKPSERRR
jgi:GT2 family glycosyltransferase